MNIRFEVTGSEFRVALRGAADSLRDPLGSQAGSFHQIGEEIQMRRPRTVRVDFNCLTYIDSTSFQKIHQEVERMRRKCPVVLTGPGPALARLFQLIPQPRSWSWGEVLRESPPPAPKREEAVPPAPPPGKFETSGTSETSEKPGKPEKSEKPQMFEKPEKPKKASPGRSSPVQPPASIQAPPPPSAPGADTDVITEVIFDREFEEGIAAELGGESPLFEPAPEEEADFDWIEGSQDPDSLLAVDAGDAPMGHLLASGEQAFRIPGFLRADASRGRLVRAFAALLERSRSRRAISNAELLQLVSELSDSVRLAPFATFDLGEASSGLPPAKSAIYTTGMALCMAARAGAPPERMRTLAMTGLLTVLAVPAGQETVPEIPKGEAALRSLAQKIHKKLIAFGGEVFGSHPLRAVSEAEVREDLRLLTVVREYWRRIGPGQGCGMEPAAAALGLANGKIALGSPARLRNLFLETFSLFPPGSWVRLESGEVGVVVAPGPGGVESPLVLRLFTGKGGELRGCTPRVVDTAAGNGIQSVVRCPIRKCPPPRSILRVETEMNV